MLPQTSYERRSSSDRARHAAERGGWPSPREFASYHSW